MKEKILFLSVIALIGSFFVGCQPKDPVDDPKQPVDTTEQPVDTTDTTKQPVDTTTLPESFARKQLIEHFTGEDCGYCPMGMDYIDKAIKGKESQYVWLSNHSGYADDEFTITESKRIASKFNVDGAPSIMLNRVKWTYTGDNGPESSVVLHPYYLSELTRKVSATTTASVIINNTFDAAAKELKINISGQSINNEELQLVVAVKESGLHGPQADYYNTWEGWQDFVHTNVVRAYVSSYLGDTVHLSNHAYKNEYTLTWNEAWNADNSSVVAFIINKSGEVLNAEEAPVVSGTTGGSDFHHEGVTAVPVPDTYPEYDTLPAGAQNVTFKNMQFSYAGKLGNNKVFEVILIALNKIKYNGANTQPLAVIYVIADPSAKTNALPTGTFEINSTQQAGTVWAGYRNDAEFDVNGSMLYLAQTTYLTQGYIVGNRWLLTDGTVTISNDYVQYTSTTLTGTAVTGVYGTAPANMQQRYEHITPLRPAISTNPLIRTCRKIAE